MSVLKDTYYELRKKGREDAEWKNRELRTQYNSLAKGAQSQR